MERTIVVERLANVHSHLREGNFIKPLTELAVDGGADVLMPMPNTSAGLRTKNDVIAYCAQVQSHIALDRNVKIVPVFLLTEETTKEEILSCANQGGIRDAKVYPLCRTTKSHNGVRHYIRILDLVKYCGKVGIRVHFHPEHPWMLIDNRDAEYQFLPIVDMFLNETQATLVWEHGTDGRCISFWKEMAESGRFFVTITAHHLATCEDESYGDVRAVCKPPIKLRRDKNDLIQFVQEGNFWVMAGLDDAPHDVQVKHVHEGQCACGAYTAPFGLQLYAHTLNHILKTDEGAVKFIRFTSWNARRFHNLPRASSVVLVEKPFRISQSYYVGTGLIEPFWAGKEIKYSLS